MNIKNTIFEIEKGLYNQLCNDFASEFANTWLPSHDLGHHKRVWLHAKELLNSYSKSGIQFAPDFIRALIIATFFHDIGLTKTLSPKHGIESAKIAMTHIAKYNLTDEKLKKQVQEAIIKHDNKEYLTTYKEKSMKPGIYTILTVADDLDAFGAIGLYRYIEIYCLRGIYGDNRVNLISENLANRFNFVSKIISFDNNLYNIHLKRLNITKELLHRFDEQDWKELDNCIENKTNLLNPLLQETQNKTLIKFTELINTELSNMIVY